jgi:hypothetical protein
MKHFCKIAIVAALTAVVLALAAGAGALPVPGTPFNKIQIILDDVTGGSGFGHIKFSQPRDADKIAYLDTRVVNLAPSHEYLLQRAVDTTVDDVCTSTAWLTLGKGSAPQSITTDDHGMARELLFRDLAAIPTGTQFDIHFRVVDALTGAPVLESDCYQFTVIQ